ncbi:hypothetical protein BUALT_Bualt14G0031500 [Buddleja alternifolia]|uniref:Maf-like protein n=1 Tax=Buddleja alternifolia TaxID=168488 RepID=A0AAV6WHQ3_9LAMI|nr:hypothetical protein BUALT_Bualt14G0031500 [Buddleja alternifolia]
MAPKNQSFEIILGSSSMARREILAEMGYEFTIMTADVDEKEKPEDLVMALAEAKADAIMMRLKGSAELEEKLLPTLLITADTVVVYEGIIREKPSSKEEARQFIRDYSGGSAGVVGSVLVTNLVTGIRKGGWESAEVYFLDVPDEVVDSLIEDGIILNVAGGLMLEHLLTLPLIDTVVSSLSLSHKIIIAIACLIEHLLL